jgi:flap endonuclease-1
MGIKNLRVILAQKCKLAINTRKLDSYRGMTIGIDLSIFLYKYLYNNNDPIEGLTRLILRLMKNQITPLFVFDGKPPSEKDDVLMDRKEKKALLYIKRDIINKVIEKDENILINDFKESINQYIESTNIPFKIDDIEMNELFNKDKEELQIEYDKINKKIIHVTNEHIVNSKKLFELFGIKYIHVDCEAESLLALLCKNGIIDGCISEDTDILANGGYLFLRNFNADKNTIDEYCLHGILDNLQMTHDQFIDMCILCGCDYTSKINGMGPITAYKLIKKYNNLENVFSNNSKFIIPNNFDYVKARYLFNNPLPKEIYDNIDKNFKMDKPNIEELKNFLNSSKLHNKYSIEIDNNLMNYYLNINGVYQLNNENNKINIKSKKITDFFQIK